MFNLRHGQWGLLALIQFTTHSLVWADLPPYNGPYGVGIIDIEVPVSRETSNYTITTTQKPAFDLDTVLFALYYPTGKDSNSSSTRHPWVPQPQDLFGRGLSAYANASGVDIPGSLIETGLSIIAGSTNIPAGVDVPISPGNISFPVMVFSHGDASGRTFYSQYLGQLASQGIVVAAVEHRDGSSPGTQVTMKTQGLLRNVTYFGPKDLSPAIANDTFKSAQRQLRQAEIRETYNVLRRIADGGGQAVYDNSSRGEGRTLANWTGRLNFENFVVAGHSFGATLVSQVLEPNATSTIPAKAAIALDPGKDSGPLYTNISVPLLVLDSESWSSQASSFYGQPHFDVVKSMATSSLNKTQAGWFMTLLGASHATITDAGVISPLFTSFFDSSFNSTLNTTVGIAQYVKVSNQFVIFLRNGARGENLASPATYPQYNVSSDVAGVPGDVSEFWQVHVSPAANASSTNSAGNGTSTSDSPPSSMTTKQSDGNVSLLSQPLIWFCTILGLLSVL